MQGGATGRPGKALSRKRHLHRDSRLGELHQADIGKGQPEMKEQSLGGGSHGCFTRKGSHGEENGTEDIGRRWKASKNL